MHACSMYVRLCVLHVSRSYVCMYMCTLHDVLSGFVHKYIQHKCMYVSMYERVIQLIRYIWELRRGSRYHRDHIGFRCIGRHETRGDDIAWGSGNAIFGCRNTSGWTRTAAHAALEWIEKKFWRLPPHPQLEMAGYSFLSLSWKTSFSLS